MPVTRKKCSSSSMDLSFCSFNYEGATISVPLLSPVILSLLVITGNSWRTKRNFACWHWASYELTMISPYHNRHQHIVYCWFPSLRGVVAAWSVTVEWPRFSHNLLGSQRGSGQEAGTDPSWIRHRSELVCRRASGATWGIGLQVYRFHSLVVLDTLYDVTNGEITGAQQHWQPLVWI